MPVTLWEWVQLVLFSLGGVLLLTLGIGGSYAQWVIKRVPRSSKRKQVLEKGADASAESESVQS